MRRRLTPELMDDPAIDLDEHRGALRGLARLNRLSRASSSLWHAIREHARQSGRSLSMVDIACGSGDVPIDIACRARREGLTLTVAGSDISPFALSEAERRAAGLGVEIETMQSDVVQDGLGRRFDIVTCSLFCHHLEETNVVRLLGHMRAATRQLLLVSDLRRDLAGLWLAVAVSRAATRSRVVHVDAAKSVRAAFSLAEMRSMAERAGLHGARVAPQWPRRMLLTWRPTDQHARDGTPSSSEPARPAR